MSPEVSKINDAPLPVSEFNGKSEIPADAQNAIEVSHIVKRYGDFTAVDDVSFEVKEGEIFGLLGPNGAGKSTLIRMMTTLIPITAGSAHVAGHDVSKEPNEARRAIGVIPQAMTSDIAALRRARPAARGRPCGGSAAPAGPPPRNVHLIRP